MSYNYSALLGKIVEVFGTQAKFAEALGVSEHTVSLRLNGKRQAFYDAVKSVTD